MEKKKKPFYKRWWFILIVVVLCIQAVLKAVTGSTTPGGSSASAKPTSSPKPSDALLVLQTETAAPTEAPTEEPLLQLPTDSPRPTFDPSLGKDISGFHVALNRNVNNDVTGNWRVAQISETIDFNEYALSYYQEYFGSDSEVHFVINRTYGTTTRMNASGGLLSLSVYEYVKGEELDAKMLPAGMLLGKYTVDMKTGEIEDVTNAN